jgi:hypothetical protein
MADHTQESQEALEKVNKLFERSALWGVVLVVVLVAILMLKGLVG